MLYKGILQYSEFLLLFCIFCTNDLYNYLNFKKFLAICMYYTNNFYNFQNFKNFLQFCMFHFNIFILFWILRNLLQFCMFVQRISIIFRILNNFLQLYMFCTINFQKCCMICTKDFYNFKDFYKYLTILHALYKKCLKFSDNSKYFVKLFL